MTHTATNPHRPLRTLAALALLVVGALLSVATSSSPPVIDEVTPGVGQSSVPTRQPVTVRFEQPLDAATVTAATARLVDADGQPVAATIAITEDRLSLSLTPADALRCSADYALELDLAAITSEGGQSYAGLRWDSHTDSVWEVTGVLRVPFTTRTALTVAQAFQIADPRELWVYFSEAVDPATLIREAVTLSSPAGDVAVDLRYDEAGRRMRVLPLAPLADGVEHTLRLAASITTPDGEPLGQGLGEVISLRPGDERLR
jgi:hypothetical protein